MPGLTLDATASAVPSHVNQPAADGAPRKTSDKTISGVFAYTNGADVETGLSDYSHANSLKTPRPASYSSSVKGLQNGNLRTSRDLSHLKTDSVHSANSFGGKSYEPMFTNGAQVESPVEEEMINGDTEKQEHEEKELDKLGPLNDREKGKSISSLQPPSDLQTLTTASDSTFSATDGVPNRHLTVPNPRSRGALPHRFSSPPGLSPNATNQERPVSADAGTVQHAPKLIHRHTLNVPKPSSAAGPSPRERDFSFVGRGSEEQAFATGRFSPARDPDGITHRPRRASLALMRRTTKPQQESYQDDLIPDEDAARWTEVVKQKRASRRRRREEEDDDRVVVGKKVEEGHVNWVTAYNMLTGIRFTVSRTNAKMDRDLIDSDFGAKHKFSFDIMGTELTPSAKYDFKFKDYSPWVFRHLRSIFGLDPADYLMSLTSKYILSELGSPGKSGSFFYFSRDYKYIIKTIHHAEHKLLRKILKEYYQHVVANPNTLISQFYGLHRVKIPYGRKIHFVVMNNLFPPHRDIHQTFDLKGSTIGRDFKEEDLVNNPRATLKDLNWLRRDYHLQFNPQVKQLFIEQLQRDVALLQKLHIMDYSLLVGMHDVEKGNEENVRENMLQVFQPGGERDADGRGLAMLMRTPSKLENIRKAKELRLTLKKEKPVPIGLMQAKMPDEMSSTDERSNRIFYSDDGGIRATHEDGTKADTIYYLGVIDCLTHYGFVKRLENFWKGLSSPRSQISPVPPYAYGDRFVNFITGITMTQEEADRRKTQESERGEKVAETAGIDQMQQQGHGQDHRIDRLLSPMNHDVAMSPPATPTAVERTIRKAQTQVEKATPATKSRRESEEENPDRTIHTVDEPRTSLVLPMVSEAAEERQPSPDVAAKHGVQLPSLPRSAGVASASGTQGSRSRGSTGIRQVSSSIAGDEIDELPTLSTTSSNDGTHASTIEKHDNSPVQYNRKRGDTGSPRLADDLIPRFTPIYDSPDFLEPSKSLYNSNGETIEGFEKIPGIALGSDDGGHRYGTS